MRIPVLCYHAMNVAGLDYAANDHVALASDLGTIAALGLAIVPLSRVADALHGEAPWPRDAVAISFDDGSWWDWHDLPHPTFGPQKSFANLLRDHARETGRAVHATAFVIVSPAARAILDRTCMIDRGWWTDDWWRDAAAEGLLAIENHSWDHNHATLPPTGPARGTFRVIDTYRLADDEIRHAADHLDALLAPRRTTLFAYPYGETNDYLVREYFPRLRVEHRVRAAFTTEPAHVTPASSPWCVPRYVCGQHWQSPAELERILRA